MKLLLHALIRIAIMAGLWQLSSYAIERLYTNPDPLGLGLTMMLILGLLTAIGAAIDGFRLGWKPAAVIWSITTFITAATIFAVPGVIDAMRNPEGPVAQGNVFTGSLPLIAAYVASAMLAARIASLFHSSNSPTL